MGKSKVYLVLILILIVALLLRVYNIDAKADGTDEKWSFIMTDQIVDGTFLQNVGTHAHVPLFYVFLAPFWWLSGKSILVLRLLMILLGLISIIVTFFFAKKIFNEKIALLTAYLLALSPFHLIYSQHIRAYALLMIMCIGAIIIMMKYLKDEKIIGLIGLTAIYIAAFYIHMFAAFFVFAQYSIFLVLKITKETKIKIKPIIISGIITALGWALWIPFFKEQYNLNITQGAIKTITTLNPIHVPYTWYKYAVAMDFSYALKNHFSVIILAVGLVGLAIYGLYKIWKTGKKEFIIMAGNVALPVVFLAAIGIFFPVYSFRYVSYLVPLFMMLVAKSLIEIQNAKVRYTALTIITIIWLIVLKVYWSVFIEYKWGLEFAI
ncbi:glycosyltransferase family 39 protein [Candidatus Woesearchaeota archaeon]|nr:glycosyltransferase family 39 protein [Candidatus Woesearchaeota archaeon]